MINQIISKALQPAINLQWMDGAVIASVNFTHNITYHLSPTYSRNNTYILVTMTGVATAIS
ncbi:MAG TPA: hypothetical protein VE223_05085 [Nitrososphaeraceae archaeon]|nr:hypothetical protein [Nitrososphaeraceae archaeon]